MTSVAVIIPTYNRAAVLPRALDSVLQQRRPADEIIVIDDGSTDATAALLARHYPQARYCRQRHQGVSAARNLGIRTATAEWLAFLDSDDVWLASKLERQLLAPRAASRLIHCDEIWIRDGRRINPGRKHAKAGGWIYQRCLPLCAISPSAALIRRSVFAEVGGFDETLPACEDYDLWLRICARHAVDYVDEALVVKHGGHADQLSRQYWGMDRFRITALEKILATDILSPKDREATLRTLLGKLEIYLKGAEKRGKIKEMFHCKAKQAHYASLLKYATVSGV